MQLSSCMDGPAGGYIISSNCILPVWHSFLGMFSSMLLTPCMCTLRVPTSELAAALWEPCPGLPACPRYVWSYGDWVCSNQAGCGGGLAVRAATCRLAGSTAGGLGAGLIIDTVPC